MPRAEDVISGLVDRFGEDKLALAASWQKETAVLVDMVTKLASFRDSFGKHQVAQSGPAASSGDSTGRMPKLTEDAVAAEATLQRSAREGFVASAQQLADRIAGDHGKKVQVTCRGHDLVPESYRRPVKDMLI